MRIDNVEEHTFVGGWLDSGTVVDLGMNQGRFSMEIAERYGCRVVGLEPVPELFEALPRHELVEAAQLAIGDTNGIATLYVKDGSDASIVGSGQPVDVEQITLGALFERFGIDHVDLLKVDVEAAEVPMFASATSDDLRRISQMAVEFHDFLFPELKPDVERTIERLSEFFHVFRFSRTNGDVLFVNRQIAVASHQRLQLLVRKYARGGARIVKRTVLR